MSTESTPEPPDRTAADVLSVTCEEGRDVIDQQVDWVRRIDRKAIQFIRVNVLVLGVGLTALSMGEVSLAEIVDRFVNVFTASGIVTLLASMVGAAVTYGLTTVEGGVDGSDIRNTCENSYTENEMYSRLAKGYAHWISYNERIIGINVTAFLVTVLLVVDSVILLTAGAIVAVMDFTGTGRVYAWYAAVVGLLYLVNKLVYNVDGLVNRYLTYTEGST